MDTEMSEDIDHNLTPTLDSMSYGMPNQTGSILLSSGSLVREGGVPAPNPPSKGAGAASGGSPDSWAESSQPVAGRRAAAQHGLLLAAGYGRCLRCPCHGLLDLAASISSTECMHPTL